MKHRYYIGLDMGGTKVLAVLAKVGGGKVNIIDKKKFFVRGLDKRSAKKAVHDTVRGFMQKHRGIKISGIGAGLPGQVHAQKQKLMRAPNITFLKDVNWKRDLEKTFGVLVKIENDASCFTLAEALFGAGKGKSYVAGITLGTGVGGGFVINGQIFHGADGTALEVGHMIIERDKSFEDLGSGKGILCFTKKEARAVEDEARVGNKASREIYKILGKNIGIGAANLVNVLNPSIIVFGGGISHALDLMENEIRAQIKKYAVSPLAKRTKFVKSKLGREAGAIGAAVLFL